MIRQRSAGALLTVALTPILVLQTASAAVAEEPSPTAGVTASQSPTSSASVSPSASATATPSPTVPSETAAPTSSATSTPTATPTTTPTSGPPELGTELRRDKRSTISVSLATGKVAVRFRDRAVRRRPVSLQRLVDQAWVEVSRKRMDSKGRVSFATRTYNVESVYRAVELEFKVKGKIAPLRTTKTAGWKSTLYDPFTGSELNSSIWSLRRSENQGPRYCSRTTSDMMTVTGGQLIQSVNYTSDATLASAYHEHARLYWDRGCWWGGENSPTGYGVFDTAMITTRDKVTINTAKSGMVAARVKFQESQGMHAAVWLQNDTKAEIDMIEGFGYGRGISNYIHTRSKKTLNATGSRRYKLGAYVAPSKTKKKSWWDEFHTYSVNWSSTGFTFRLDGKVTQRIKIKPGNVDYSLILSNLVSDWEAYRITKPVTKGFTGVEPAQLPEQTRFEWVKVWTKV